MALQDVNSGNFGTSNQYIVYWTEMTEEWTDTNSNISNITVRVWAKRTNSGYETYGTGTCYCTIAGTQYTAGISSSQKITSTPICLFSKNLNIGHNADGTGRVDIYSQISMDVVSSGSNGWGFGLTTIPRASIPTLSASTFDMGTTITVNMNRKSTSFTHTVRYSWYSKNANIATGVTDNCTFTPPLSFADDVPNATSSWGTIFVDTYNGGTLVGTQSVTFTATVPASIVPTASSLAVSIAGTGRDKTLALYIQGISKVTASFTSAATYSATISSNTISVKRQSDGADNQNISGTSGTIANPVALSGTYVITATATDSRGRTATVTATITVQAYSPPTVTTFSTSRSSVTSTSVLATINVAWSLAANNPTNVTVVGVDKSNVSTTLYTLTGSTAGSINTTQTYTNQSDASSYTYTITITDSFGNVAKATATVGVSFVEFCLSKGYGIGVGKIWERGALDVKGDAYFDVAGGRIVGRLGYTATSGGRGSSSNTWVRICTINLTTQYTEATTSMEVVMNGSGGTTMRACLLRFRVKQQAAMGSAPYVNLIMSNQSRIIAPNVVAVTTVNTTSKTTVELWIQLTDTYDAAWYTVLHSSSSTLIVYDNGFAVAATYSAGTVTPCIKDGVVELLGADGGGQSLSVNTWSRATWSNVWENEGFVWQPGGNANMFGVTEPGWYEVFYSIQLQQSINTPFYAQLWGNPSSSGIISQWTTNNGWNEMMSNVFAYLNPNINYEIVLQHGDSGYTRSIDNQKMRVKRVA